jgi:WD40 repeat protein
MLLVAERGVCITTLLDGRQRWFDAPDQRIDQDVALSPDGGTAAVLTGDEEEAIIGLLDPATGRRRDLWRAAGAASWESGLRWSPDGRLIAATYMIWDDERDDDALSTVVIDAADGGVRAGPLVRTHVLGGWLGDRLLSYREEYDDLHRLRRLDVITGRTTAGKTITGRIWNAAQGRHIHEVNELESPGAATTTFYTTDMDGTDRRPLFTLHPKVQVRGFHLAAGVELPQG